MVVSKNGGPQPNIDPKIRESFFHTHLRNGASNFYIIPSWPTRSVSNRSLKGSPRRETRFRVGGLGFRVQVNMETCTGISWGLSGAHIEDLILSSSCGSGCYST